MKTLNKAMDIFKSGLSAVSPESAIKRWVVLNNNKLVIQNRIFDLQDYNNILIIGAGKASAHMAKALEEILEKQNLPWFGLVIVKDGHGSVLKKIDIVEASHPVPDSRGLLAAKHILNFCKKGDSKTLVISLISGGGSSLLSYPRSGVTLGEIQKTTSALLACGAEITEINCIRKHLSCVKGGRLAQASFPSSVINLMLSDVIGDPPDVIASGPFSADLSYYKDCLEIIHKYNLSDSLPVSVMDSLQSGVNSEIQETPKPDDTCFDNVYGFIIGSNRQFLMQAKIKAQELGYNVWVVSSSVSGEASEFASFYLSLAREIALYDQPVKKPACLLAGGELTVTLKGDGKGGRNQEAVLAAVEAISRIPGALFFSAGTDGTDGPTDAAGAWCDAFTLKKAEEKSLNPALFLKRNDSYHFFKNIDHMVKTGPTGTNVMDCYMLLVD